MSLRSIVDRRLYFLHYDSSAVLSEAKADGQGVVYLGHGICIQAAHFFPQSAFVDGADLFEQYDGIFGKATVFGVQLDVGGKLGLLFLACDSRRDHSRAVPIANIILYNKYWTHAALL